MSSGCSAALLGAPWFFMALALGFLVCYAVAKKMKFSAKKNG